MCRMIAVLGSLEKTKKGETIKLIKSFIKMSQGRYELNELNTKKGKFQHDSGWGIAYKEKNKFKIYKNTNPCWKDKNLKKFYNKQIFLLHARKASIGSKKIQNTHPFRKKFKNQEWFFCHNGTIKDNFPKDNLLKYKNLEGGTDSERFFLYLLKNLNEKKPIISIKTAIKKLKNYSSLNSFLLNKNTLYVVNKYKKYPKYYTLKLLKKDNHIIISSEILPKIQGKWEKLKNGQILKINLKTFEIEEL